MNLPNLLTLSRILLIPVFVLLFWTPTPGRSLAAAVVFVIAAVTDLLDGYLARRRSQVTKLGRLLDPIADKLLVLSGLILLVQLQRVAAVVAILIIAREVAVTGVRAIAASQGIVLSAETIGKYKMVAQVVAIVLLILEDGIVPAAWNLHLVGTVVLYAALALALISGGRYLLSFWRQVALKEL
ncbi:MAG: CDP-diacylglycerol--glycerol-3-phosphate 3-phosphatidyltransferase [Nitrospirae bacterium]|nr:MAG: CDP-diacylglycerol--glycerol-3-phosphate 3-phosphatidyltransferase [Nitrospirae bacterium 13_2_20CM_62_7]OLB54944.1 MAG: CDP-diacylglycerol--glycerol-3-phosphate 3-phosphatidyltransferase [Nitrospirae bacterium 13_2_20CM_2_62_8]OLB98534.1 MAG: CDP-diacylglycerol--glycerol-3-phosphate 3-phosphatidyltransferase [Nitrospirae bacterium 13_1_40CM_62_7]OLC80252.1 MAG: CDP-diacylglycerol--glycerol-3-phosphate 3-phosphatidyltransferase [Nitrospirae bacterium 13_1_40CM_3_62_11]OLD40994.1 MAG: CD